MTTSKTSLTLLALTALALTHSIATAANRRWDGGGANGFWDTAANWTNNVAPANGDALIFSDAPARLINTNRAAANLTNVSTITFAGDGYEVFSVPLNLTNGLSHAGLFSSANTLNAVLQPRASQTWSADARALLTLNSNVVFLNSPLTLTLAADVRAAFRFNGNLLGPGGVSLVKTGAGTLNLSGASNSFGGLTVSEGVLDVDGFLNANITVAAGATLQGTGSVSFVSCLGNLRPGGALPGVMSFRSTGSPVLQPGAQLTVDLNGLTPGTDYDQLKSSGPFDLTGAELVVRRSPSFAFAQGQKFVIITNSANSAAFSTTFTNLPQNGHVTNNGVVFEISYVGGNGNDVELSVVQTPFAATGNSRAWDGAGGTGNRNWSGAINWDSNTVPQRGDSLVFPAATALSLRTMTNDLQGEAAQFNHLAFGGADAPWTLHGQPLKIFGGITATNESFPLTSVDLRLAALDLLASQTWSTTNLFLRAVTPVRFGGRTLTMAGSASFERELLGPGTLVVETGIVSLPSAFAMSNVTVRLEGGKLDIQNAQATGEPWPITGGELTFGFAEIPGLKADGGRISFQGGGQVLIAGGFALAPSCTLAARFEDALDQPFVVSGPVNLGGALLETEFLDATLLGTTLTLIQNQGANQVSGTFAGLPEGAVVQSVSGASALIVSSHISYVGGNGNDVTLTPFAVLAPSTITSLQRLSEGQAQLTGESAAGLSYDIEANADLSTTNWVKLGSVLAEGTGKISFTDTNAASFPQRFYRFKQQ